MLLGGCPVQHQGHAAENSEISSGNITQCWCIRAVIIWYSSFFRDYWMEERELSSSCNIAHYYYLTFKCVRSVKCSCCTCMLYVHVDCYQIVTFTIGNLIWTDIQHTAQLCPRLCLSRWNLNIGWILICCVVAVVSRWLFVQQTPTLLCCQTHERDRYWLSLHLHIYPLYFVCFQQSIITGWLIKISQHKQLKHWQLGSALMLAQTRG